MLRVVVVVIQILLPLGARVKIPTAKSTFACPGWLQDSVCKAIRDAPDSSMTNCGPADEVVLAGVSRLETKKTIKEIAISKVPNVLSEGGWVRVQTGAAHEYVVEQTEGKYRIYQANAEGSLDLRDWLSSDADFPWMDNYAAALYGFKKTPRWSFMMNEMTGCKSSGACSWWNEIRQADETMFVKEIVRAYKDTWQKYGQGKLLSRDELLAFLETPLLVGGGSAPLAKRSWDQFVSKMLKSTKAEGRS